MTRPTLPGLVARITEVMNLPDASGKGLALTGQGYVLLHNIRADLERELSLSDDEKEAWGALSLHANGITPMADTEAQIINALLARTFPAAGGEGEGK